MAATQGTIRPAQWKGADDERGRGPGAGPHPAVGPPVITNVLLVDLYQRPAGFRGQCSSQPGHLIQLTTTGVAVHEVDGRKYMLAPGDSIWFHEDEHVKVEVIRGPWSFYTTNFTAPTLSPPPFESRAFRLEGPAEQTFQDLLSAWREVDRSSTLRAMRVQSRLLELLALFTEGRTALPFDVDPATQLWWRLETQLRSGLARPASLARMVELTGKSRATIARACRRAVGVTPQKRMKQVRMGLARSLILQSDLRIGEIASRIGYPRVHEFSRDYRRYFGVTPSSDRDRYLTMSR